MTDRMNSHSKPDAGKPSSALSAAKEAEPAVAFVDEYLPALLARASRLISTEFHRIAAARGLNVSEWRVLASLSEGDPMSIGRLARTTVTKQPTLTRVLDRMEGMGMVERIANEGDRRITLVRITAAGKAAVDKLIPLARAHEHRVLQPFGPAQAARLKATLRRMIELHEADGEADSN